MKVLFLGFRHRVNDARLFHREMKALRAACEDIQLYFLSPFNLYDLSAIFSDEQAIHALASEQARDSAKDKAPSGGIVRSVSLSLQKKIRTWRQIRKACKLRPTVVQASDARELIWALVIRLFSGARIIYDSHEDYFNQVYEYSGKSFSSLVKGYTIVLVEVLLARFFAAVFCTDDSLYQKFLQPFYGCRNVYLLRNFPFTGDMPIVSSYPEKNTLELVYIGSVNRYRGIIEAAYYIDKFNDKFNQEHSPRKLNFTIYSPHNPIVEELVQQKLLRHIAWIDYTELLSQLAQYDVGICLLHPIEKYHRNLPVKNFDYMGVGLPMITSNFGNLEKYARLSGAALCIDPLSYSEFESAILTLFDPKKREELGKNGIRYTRSSASFEVEAEPYVKVITRGAP